MRWKWLNNAVAVLLGAGATISLLSSLAPARLFPAIAAVVLAALLILAVNRQGQIPEQHVRELHRYAKAQKEMVVAGSQRGGIYDQAQGSDVVADAFRAHFPHVGAALKRWNESRQGVRDAYARIDAEATAEMSRLGLKDVQASSLHGVLTAPSMAYQAIRGIWGVEDSGLFATGDRPGEGLKGAPGPRFHLASTRFLEQAPFQKAGELQAALVASLESPDVLLARELTEQAQQQGIPLAHDLEVIEHSYEIERAKGCASCAMHYLKRRN